MPIMEISIMPIGTAKTSLSAYIAAAVRVLKKEKNIQHQLTPMGTIIQASSVRRLFSIAEKMQNAIIKRHTRRIVTSIKLDIRTDKKITLSGKLNSVLAKL